MDKLSNIVLQTTGIINVPVTLALFVKSSGMLKSLRLVWSGRLLRIALMIQIIINVSGKLIHVSATRIVRRCYALVRNRLVQAIRLNVSAMTAVRMARS